MESNTAPLLEMRGIKKDFFGNQVLTDINFTLKAGEVLGLAGENGAGKSTFLRILSGDLEPSKGEVTFDPKYRMSVLKQDHFAYEDQTIFDTCLLYTSPSPRDCS